MKAYQLYQKVFNSEHLKTLFAGKAGRSLAVGRDGIRRGRFEEKLDAEIKLIVSKIKNRDYHFTGYKQKLISKGAERRPREISIPTFRDRLALRALCEIITEVFSDARLPPPHQYVKQIKTITRGLNKDFCFLRVDIKDYYPSINQEMLLRRIRSRIRKIEILDVIANAIRTPTGKRNTTETKNSRGVPQGLSISNILASIYLLHIDKKYKAKTHYFRYVDDILIICKLSESHKIYQYLQKDLRSVCLECHPLKNGMDSKTKISPLNEGVEYLGYRIGANGVSIRASSYRRMFTNLMKVFTLYRYSKNQDGFLWRLNLKITGCIYEGKRLGWMFFFSQTDNKSQLMRLDKFVSDYVQKYKLQKLSPNIKTFIKSYHEIRFNMDKTNYIPNFEAYGDDQKVEFICLLTGKDQIEVRAWNIQDIEATFWKLISKEVSKLEKDLLEVFS